MSPSKEVFGPSKNDCPIGFYESLLPQGLTASLTCFLLDFPTKNDEDTRKFTVVAFFYLGEIDVKVRFEATFATWGVLRRSFASRYLLSFAIMEP